MPDDPDKVAQLVNYIVLLANGIRAAPGAAEVKAEDTWVVQRLPQFPEPCLIAASPASDPQNGTDVRRALHSAVQRAVATLDGVEADLKVLAMVGAFRSLADENAMIALRGMDLAAFGQLDFICLLADGRLKPILGPRFPRA